MVAGRSSDEGTGEPRPRPKRGTSRSAARLAAVQALYQMELTGAAPGAVVPEFLRHRLGAELEGQTLAPADETLFAEIVRGVAGARDELDRMIVSALSEDWTLGRLEVVLRAILRAGTFELAHRPDLPPKVTISEYVAVADAFYAGKEPGLVNGVLDRLARDLRAGELKESGG